MKPVVAARLWGLTICFLLICIVLSVRRFIWEPREREVTFSSELWLKGDTRDRGKMIQSLVSNRCLDGKAQLEVEKLLGKPDQRLDNEWEYELDMGTTFLGSVWKYRLVLEFDEKDGRVHKVMVLD